MNAGARRALHLALLPGLAAALGFGASNVLGKLALLSGTDVLAMVSFRGCVGVVCVWAWLRLSPPARTHTPHERNIALALGLLFAAYGLWRFVQWMKESAAAPEEDSAESFPLTRDDFLPRGLQYGVYGLLLAGLLARPLAGLIWPERVSDIWGSLFMSIVVVVLLLFAAAGSVMRAPNHLDRALGPRYRWLEVSLCYLLLGNLALLEMASFALELSGLGSRRHVALLVAAFVSVTLGGVLLRASLRPRAPVRH